MRDQGLTARRLVAALVTLAALAGWVGLDVGRAGPAAAATAAAPTAPDATIEQAARALQTRYVYRDPAAESGFTDAQVQILTNQAAGAGVPVWVALLPQSVLADYGGSVRAVARALAIASGQQGTYAVVVGPSAFDAVSTVAEHPVDDLVRQATRNGSAPFDAVSSFLDSVRSTYGVDAAGRARSTGGGTAIAVLVLIAAGGGALAIVSRRRRRRAARAAAATEGLDVMRDYPSPLVPADHVEPVPRRIRAMIGTETVLDTTAALYVWEWPRYPQYYVPLADVQADLLVPEDSVEDTSRGPMQVHGLRLGDTYRAAGARVLRAPTVAELADTVRFDWTAMDAWFEEDERVFVHPRSPYVRVDALRSTRHVRIERDGVVLAETSSPVLLFETGLPTRYYVNRTEVDFSHLEWSDTVTECPYKGTTGGYWSARIDGRLHPDIAWCYEFPTRDLEPIAGLVAFYNERVDLYVDGELLERPSTHFSRGHDD